MIVLIMIAKVYPICICRGICDSNMFYIVTLLSNTGTIDLFAFHINTTSEFCYQNYAELVGEIPDQSCFLFMMCVVLLVIIEFE